MALAGLLAGCARLAEGDVGQVALAFEDPAGDPAARCALLTPATRAALESDESMPCTDAIGRLPLGGGAVRAVEVWGDEAQVRMTDDTVFLTRTDAGWRVAAAACQARREAPYDCQVEGP
ncbi:hypothetical protein DQ238_09885 [Geodermatophilus sp. TF02-6]|nr:hypothetical protein DQ238_09885 [Geodermatophilus sp. TF02-6]